ncbi:MAG: hypothetical protein O3A13_03530 [Proteobacteria bacterium]|nr:hypothetical protein [Pseudomonadota bacterium]MDA0992685.1 hypothetical protein [Pseudomonadota bacterium]
MSNHLNSFYAAVSVLAGHGDIKQRLIKAFEENLAEVDVDELPVTVKQSFADLRKMMSGVAPLNGEGRIRATVRKMSIVEADECAHMMIELYTEVVQFADLARESVPVRIGSKTHVPPFLIKSV